ncbi:hypothetical protein ZIOFF_002733 [Zingiber officinale]|uniref:Uncharacterized protein n=1 Tax=Zingiber officinale TaxID=94328 RepID=A0A8J5IRF2_ZINOF|nr:hypothetical protein ZIOFF_002733 [Zingiber officinale]
METGHRRARRNAKRAGLVAVGAVAFAYLSFQVGFKPYIERVQEAMDRPQQERSGEADPPSSPPDASSVEYRRIKLLLSSDVFYNLYLSTENHHEWYYGVC